MSKAVCSLMSKLEPCQLRTTFFAGQPMFTSIPAMLYLGSDIIFAAFANTSGSLPNI